MWKSILDNVITPDGRHARISVDDATFLYENAPLEALMKVARNVRRIHNPDGIITYLVDRNVNYTNICTINCQFCSFYRPPGHEEVYTQSIEQISA